MSNPTHLKRLRRAGIAVAVACSFLAVPVAAQAQVDLGTASPFVVLGGSTVTNTGPSVLNGDLGVSPGSALVGFGLPAVVNGATHATDGVALQAQADLTTAYLVAEADPVAPGNDLTGTNLGNRILTAGAYGYSTSAQLTGQLILDAQGDPNAQFVFEIGSTLTTASASSVLLVNGASPCNVYWQVGSSATIGTTTAFQGNVMALTSITLDTGATVIGRMLAQNGAVTLDTNVLTRPLCATGSTPTTTLPGSQVTPGGSTVPSGPGAVLPTAGTTQAERRAALRAERRRQIRIAQRGGRGTATIRRLTREGSTGREVCTEGFRAAVRGHLIRRVVFSLDGRRIASRTGSPFQVHVLAAPGRHNVRARVTFTDSSRAKTMNLGYRACAAQVLQPRRGPSQFTG